jgi:hypothetical protein
MLRSVASHERQAFTILRNSRIPTFASTQQSRSSLSNDGLAGRQGLLGDLAGAV